MRSVIIVAVLAMTPITQADGALLAVGKFQPGTLSVYSVSPAGAIAEIQQAGVFSYGGEVLVDRGGRFVAYRGSSLHLHRIGPDRRLAPAVTYSPPASASFIQSLGLSQDGRMALALLMDRSVEPKHFEFQTFLVNNRLQLSPTGFSLNADDLGGIGFWTISDRATYTSIVEQASQSRLTILHLSPRGEITDTGQRIPTPEPINVDADMSADGRWMLNGRQSGIVVDAALYEVSSSGEVTFRSSGHWPDLGFVANVRLWPDPTGILIAGDPGLFSVSRAPESQLGDILDHEVPAYGRCQGLAVSSDGGMVLVDDQAPGFTFPLYSYLLSEDGQLTATGYHLSRPDHHADLRFIPDPTPVTLAGDANCDGAVDVADAVFLINEALPDDKPILLPQNFANADLDNDVDVDEADFEGLVEMLLNP